MDFSIVVPVYNEIENIPILHREISEVMQSLAHSYEVIYVDDGSTDGSQEALRTIHDADGKVRVIRFRRNFGQTAAVAAGLHYSRGDVVITMDGDLQNDPADIPLLLEKLETGYDMVCGWRKERKDDFWLRRLPSVAANFIIRWSTNVKVHDYGCMLKVYRGEIARSLRLYGEMHRFIPAIAVDLGASVCEIEVHHRPRIHGSSKYGLSRALRVVLDLVTVKFLSVFSTRPLHVFGLLGLAMGGPGSILLVWLGAQKVFFGAELSSRPILLLAILLVIMGVQFVTMGLLAEMLARTYHESQDKPVYVIAEDLTRADDAGDEASGIAGRGRSWYGANPHYS